MSKNICIPANYFLILIIIFIIFTYMYYSSVGYKLNKLKIDNNLSAFRSEKSNILNLDSLEYENNLNNNLKILPLKQLLENSNRSTIYNNIHEYKKNIILSEYIDQIGEDLVNQNLSNANSPIFRKMLENRDRSIINDPIVAPERRVDVVQYPSTIKNTINIPTRGYPDNYQMVGLVSRDSDEKFLQLFGRATFPGSNQYEYYVTTSEFGFQNKIPIGTRGSKEIMDGDTINIPEFKKEKGEFKVKLYNYNTPRYNPYII